VPGTPYPAPQRHPVDHIFSWERGRILQAYQIVLITAGRGTFESSNLRRKAAIEANTLFLLFPGIWHRYAPDPQIGWTEHWIECRGPAFDFGRDRSILRPEDPIRGVTPEIIATFAAIHREAEDALGNQPVISALGLQLLAQLACPTGTSDNGAARVVQKAKLLIMERCDEPLNMEALAAELNLGYSHFRQIFKHQTGTSPKQYHLAARIERASDLMVNTDKSLKEIAALLGFYSEFHFSNQFRRIVGLSPKAWREQFNAELVHHSKSAEARRPRGHAGADANPRLEVLLQSL
jgi:AraC-like DNA-binding protein